MNRRFGAVLACAVALATPALAADTYVVDKGHSEVGFQIGHLGLSKMRGRFKDFDGTIRVDPAKPTASSVEFTVKTASIDTDNEKRDQDLRTGEGLLEVEKYPTLTFKSSKVVPKSKDHYDVTGTLTLHGVSKEVTMPVAVIGPIKDPWGNQRVSFEINTTLNRKDYGISYHKVLDTGGLVVGDDVSISITLEAVKQKEGAGD
jgi:polyisoprenoid-binding protein YceI